MVSFIADPRIKRAAQQRQLMLARALQPYKLPQNPYGGSPVWGNLQRLAEGYLAGQAGKRATSLEKAQKDAQGKIMAQILQLQQPPAGSTLNIQETEGIRGIGDDGRIIPAQVSRRPYSTEMPTISAEVLETAGLSPAGFQLAAQKARTAGRTAYTAAQEAEIDRRLEAVTSAIALSGEGPERTQLQRQRSQLLAVKDAAKSAESQETQERTRAKEKRQEERGLDVLVDVFDIELGRNRKVTKREMRLNPDNFVKAKSDEKKLTKYEANIKSLMGQGVRREDAEDIAYGRVEIIADPDTKQSYLYNFRDQTSTPLVLSPTKKLKPPVADQLKTRPQKRKKKTLWDMVGKGPRITGIVAGVQIPGEEILGQIPGISGEIEAAPNQIENYTELNAARSQLITALAINKRFPAAEIARVEKEVDIAPSIWLSTDGLLKRMKGVDNYLRSRLQNELAASVDMTLPSETRQNARTAAKDIKSFLDKLGVPQPGGETSDDLSKLSDDELLKKLGIR
jgi:hypothetical protein